MGTLSADLSFRRAVPADAAAVRDFVRRAYQRWVAVVGREPLPMTADYEEALRRHRIDLLMAGETWAGLIETVPGGGVLLVENVALGPTFQGRGLGRRLRAPTKISAPFCGAPSS